MYRTDCHFYSEDHDMGATIPICTYYNKYGYCPCDNDCSKYITQSAANEMIKQHVDTRVIYKRAGKVQKNCDECVFGIFYVIDATRRERVCVGFEGTNPEGAARIAASGPCEMFEEGKRLKDEILSSGLLPTEYMDTVSADRAHIYNRKDYSEQPAGKCNEINGACLRMACKSGLCYSKHACPMCIKENELRKDN